MVTGAGSGLGMECALSLAKRNYRVYGTVLNAAEGSALETQAHSRNVQVRALQMDVTQQSQVAAAVETMLQEAGSVHVLVQFAGLGLRGFFEDLSLEEIRHVYDVNVFGIMAVTQAVLPHMRAARSGRIVITSSVAGRMGSMSISGYSSSKFAVEGFAECLSQEVAPFGIQVSLLEPGLIYTPHFTVNRNRARRALDPNGPYYTWFCQHEKLVDDLLRTNKVTPSEIADVVFSILNAKRPNLRYLVGVKAKAVVNLRRYIPGELFERIYFYFLRRMVTNSLEPARTLQ
jgi:NAD(P)-dependent dehydrogenase (short-subunit alcohol dehydrogenase family)